MASWSSPPNSSAAEKSAVDRPGIQVPGMEQGTAYVLRPLPQPENRVHRLVVMRLKEENMELRDIVKSYNLRGFSFREYLNLQTGMKFHAYSVGKKS